MWDADAQLKFYKVMTPLLYASESWGVRKGGFTDGLFRNKTFWTVKDLQDSKYGTRN